MDNHFEKTEVNAATRNVAKFPMQRLNYHHLLYFWRVARDGGLAPAGKLLRLSPQTLSGQIRALEDAMGHKLFEKRGRKLTLTDAGRVAYEYAEDIFSLGQELTDVLERGTLDRPRHLEVGLVDGIPKMVSTRMLSALTAGEQPIVLRCREGPLQELVAALGSHTLDVVLADEPLPSSSGVRAFSHLLGETGVTFFVSPRLALPRDHARFPANLDGARFLLPFPHSPLRRQIDAFFARRRITPVIVAEVEDNGLLKAFGHAGQGVFCGTTNVAHEIREMYGVRALGSTEEIMERFYAISGERRVKHAGVVALLDAARRQIFG